MSGRLLGVFAYEMSKLGKMLVIDKRSYSVNVFTEEISGINVHKYGPHIFIQIMRMYGLIINLQDLTIYKYANGEIQG